MGGNSKGTSPGQGTRRAAENGTRPLVSTPRPAAPAATMTATAHGRRRTGHTQAASRPLSRRAEDRGLAAGSDQPHARAHPVRAQSPRGGHSHSQPPDPPSRDSDPRQAVPTGDRVEPAQVGMDIVGLVPGGGSPGTGDKHAVVFSAGGGGGRVSGAGGSLRRGRHLPADRLGRVWPVPMVATASTRRRRRRGHDQWRGTCRRRVGSRVGMDMPVMPAASQQTMGEQQDRHQPRDQPPLHPLPPLSGITHAEITPAEITQPSATAEPPNHNAHWKPRRDWKFGQFQFGLGS